MSMQATSTVLPTDACPRHHQAMLSGEGLFRGANRKERRSSLVMAATKRIDGLAKLDASKAKTVRSVAWPAW